MRSTLSLIRREFSAYFYSPVAYVVLAVFLAVTGHLFYLSLELLTARGPRGISYPMEMFVSNTPFWLAFLSLAPLLTMRLFAEERSTGTLEMLMTAPVREWQVVFAKFAACYGFYLLMWVPTFLYLLILADAHLVTVRYGTEPLDVFMIYVAARGLRGRHDVRRADAVHRTHVSTAARRRVRACFRAVLARARRIPGACRSIWIGNGTSIECYIDPWPIATTYLGIALAGECFLSIGPVRQQLWSKAK